MENEQLEQYLQDTYALTKPESVLFVKLNGNQGITKALAVQVRNFIEQQWHDTSMEAWDDKEERIRDREDYEEDLEARGFFNGTDDPMLDEQITRGQMFEDKLAMYRNEY
jgi:hypothetical protein